jgi:hypothetical protein
LDNYFSIVVYDHDTDGGEFHDAISVERPYRP